MSPRLFIRNDDVWRIDPGFRFFFDAAAGRNIPVVHAVIPGRMEPDLVRFLCRAREKTPRLLDIVQHGWMHTDHSGGQEDKYEFGARRPLESQTLDIHKGRIQMRRAFGTHLTDAFVPPYHGYDARTLSALKGEGFKIFSAGTRRTGARQLFLELPVQVAFSRYEEGRPKINPARRVLALLAGDIYRRALCGVLTHHADFGSADARRQLEMFLDGIAALRAREGWKVLLFSEILSALQKGS